MWSRRPCNGWGPGRYTKTITHRIERRRAKIDTLKDLHGQ